jgi:hypothetical protein
VKQACFIDWIESQSEYVKACQLGYGYTRQGNYAHYLFLANQTEPSVLAEFRAKYGIRAIAYIWTFKGRTMASKDGYGEGPYITPLTREQGVLNWTTYTHAAAAMIESGQAVLDSDRPLPKDFQYPEVDELRREKDADQVADYREAVNDMLRDQGKL